MTAIPKPSGKVRWIVCGLLFAVVVLSYIDRLVLPTLKPDLQARYGWSERGYADLAIWFQAGYGISYAFFGRLIDRIDGMLMAKFAGTILETVGGYRPIFAVASCAYLVALFWLRFALFISLYHAIRALTPVSMESRRDQATPPAPRPSLSR